MTEHLSEIPAAFVADIEEGQRFRGWIANSYGQIEFLLGDLILRSMGFAEYAGLPSTLPHGAVDRVKRVRRILDVQGPLSLFQRDLNKILSGFEMGHETRNLLAHGFCEYLYTQNGDAGLQFQKWHRQEDREDARLIKLFRLSDLRIEKEKFVELSIGAMSLFQEIHEYFCWTSRVDR